MIKKIKFIYYFTHNTLVCYYEVKEKNNEIYRNYSSSGLVASFFNTLAIFNIIEFLISLIRQKNTYMFSLFGNIVYYVSGLIFTIVLDQYLYMRNKNYEPLYEEYLTNTTKFQRIFYGIIVVIYFLFGVFGTILKPWLVWN